MSDMNNLETTIMLEICMSNTIHRLPMANLRTARRALNALEKKIGEKFSNDPDKRKHRVKSMAGELVFTVSEVHAVNLVDYAKYLQAVKPTREIELQI